MPDTANANLESEFAQGHIQAVLMTVQYRAGLLYHALGCLDVRFMSAFYLNLADNTILTHINLLILYIWFML